MSKLNVILPTGEKVDAEIVRYFDTYGKKYLVYTLNEKDEQGFVKLYVAKLNGAPRALVGEFIEDDNEWSVLKGEFKKIIGENGDSGHTTANDINPNELENVNVRGHRIIKLMESYVNLLGANKKNFEVAPVAPNPGTEFQGFGDVLPNYQQQPTPEPIPFVSPNQGFPSQMAYQTQNVQPTPNYFEAQNLNNPIRNSAPQQEFDYQQPAPSYPNVQNFGEIPSNTNEPLGFAPSTLEMNDSPSNANYEEMYNDVKAKLERCTAELEKVTNENIDLRIKIDDIREILNGN